MVTISGVTWRITIVAEGLAGKSCGILAAFLILFVFSLALDVSVDVSWSYRSSSPCSNKLEKFSILKY